MSFASQVPNSTSTTTTTTTTTTQSVADPNLSPIPVSQSVAGSQATAALLSVVDDHAARTRALQDISFGGHSIGHNMTGGQDVESEGRPPYTHVGIFSISSDCRAGSLCIGTSGLRNVEITDLTSLQAMLAGGIGGCTGDLLMHSLDTVKTRQQGDPHIPPKYTSLGSSYYKIWQQEGLRRGLYGGWIPAALGSFPGTVMFFGTYEWSKRFLIDHGVQQHISYLAAGMHYPAV